VLVRAAHFGVPVCFSPLLERQGAWPGLARHMATQPGVARGFNASADATATLMTDFCPGRVSAHATKIRSTNTPGA
jgi:hypothetical protein